MPSPMVRVKIGENEIEGPADQLPNVFRDYPNAQVIGEAPKPSISQEVASTAAKRFGQFQDIPTTALFAGMQGLGSSIKRVKDKLPSSDTIASNLGERGINPVVAATAGAGADLAKTFLPENDMEVAMQVAGGKALDEGVRAYASRVAPSLIEYFYGPTTGKIGAEALARNPQKVANIANLGKEGAARAEKEAVGKVRAGVGRVIKSARNAFGSAKAKILQQSGNPSINATALQQDTVRALGQFNALPELKTFASADPRYATVANSVINDTLEFATRPGSVKATELMRFRENLNRLMRSPLSDQAKGALTAIKNSVDNNLTQALGPDLMKQYGQANRAFGEVAGKYENIRKLVYKSNSGPKIIRELEGSAVQPGPTELGLELQDFLKNATDLDNLKDVIGGRRFTEDVYGNLRSGASIQGMASAMSAAPSLVPGAGLAGRAGLPVTPRGLANFAGALDRLTTPITRLAAPFAVRPGANLFQ